MSQAVRPPPGMPALLRGVSRSFYLSIRLLPQELRAPVGIAYLLARAADTLADASGMPVAARKDRLENLAAAFDGDGPAIEAVAGLASAFTPLQAHPDEQALLRALPQCLRWLDQLPPADRDDVRAVLRHITYGQSLDIQRFPSGGPPAALQTAAQLDEYTYLVAGSVGEFWTDLCLRHLPDFARLPPHEMRELGRGYGQALQLVNVVRDAAADLAAGRCYFPADELAAAGLQPADVARNPERFEGVRMRWLAKAQQGLETGLRYAIAVENRRVRAAAAIPALLGARTVAMLRAAGPRALQERVKMPRGEVRAVLARLALTLAARGTLQSTFARLSGEA